jgi:hypothetical protein
MFPVTVGGRIAIPVGTFVDGTILSPGKTKHPDVYALIHFTHLTFANGYTARLTAQAQSAMLILPSAQGSRAFGHDVVYASPYQGGAHLIDANYYPDRSDAPYLQQVDQYCPGAPYPCVDESAGYNQHPGPNPAVVGGAVAGGFVLLLGGAMLLMHHENAKAGDLLLTDGTQFQMKLTATITLDAAQVAQAATTGSI